MAGIWDRIRNRGENDDPIASLTLVGTMYLVVRNIITGVQARDALNATLSAPLTVAEIADLNQLATQFGTGTTTAKMDLMWRLQSMCIAAEVGLLNNEATFRSELGLT